jgi:hypothetical protein
MNPEQLAKDYVKNKRLNDAAKVARQLAETPTAQAAQKLANSPTVKAARELADSPTGKLARKLAESRAAEAARQEMAFGIDLELMQKQVEEMATTSDRVGRGPILPQAIDAPPVELLKSDTDRLIHQQREISEKQRELDQKLVDTSENMHAALVEANHRAKTAEDRTADIQDSTDSRERWMLRLTVVVVILATLTLAAGVVAVIVAINAGS